MKCATAESFKVECECWAVDAGFALVHPRDFSLARYSHFQNIGPYLSLRITLTSDIAASAHSRS